ncbi:MAG: hypothetical protein AAF914_09975 [Pseudomonadota bacterium]
MHRRTVWILMAVWLVGMVMPDVVLLTADATGEGPSRGANRIAGCLGWQLAGAFVGFLCFVGARAQPEGDLVRRLGLIPPLWAVIRALMIAACLAVAGGSG